MDYESSVKATTLQLTILLFSFVSGVLLFTVTGIALGPVFDEQGIEDTGKILRLVAIVLPLAAIPAAAQVYMLQSKRIAGLDGWNARMNAYRSRAIIMTAMFEGPALFSAAVILLTGLCWHAVPALALFMAAMGGLVPTRGRIIGAIGNEDGSKPDQYS